MRTTWSKDAVITWKGPKVAEHFPGRCGDCKFWDDREVSKWGTGECFMDFSVKSRSNGCLMFEQIESQ